MNSKALIIEDDFDLANIFAEAIKAAGFDTEVIHDGLIAQSRLKEGPTNLIVLDMHLPHVDGSALLSQIRTDPSFKKTILILATADALMGDMYREQADFVLIKPISFTQLRDLTSRLNQQR